MPRKSKIPPRRFNLKADGSSYIVLAWDDGLFHVAYYRPYVVGEDGVEDEATARAIHKRFAIRRAKLIDALRIVFCEDMKSEWDADMVEYMVRQDPRIPKFPGRAHRPEEDDYEQPQEWVPVSVEYTKQGAQQLAIDTPPQDPA